MKIVPLISHFLDKNLFKKLPENPGVFKAKIPPARPRRTRLRVCYHYVRLALWNCRGRAMVRYKLMQINQLSLIYLEKQRIVRKYITLARLVVQEIIIKIKKNSKLALYRKISARYLRIKYSRRFYIKFKNALKMHFLGESLKSIGFV